MKIGILTVPFNNNYGGYLQSYALMTILKELNHTPILINRRQNKQSILHQSIFFSKQLIKTILKFKKQKLFQSEQSFRFRGKEMLKFVHKYIQPITSPIYNSKDLSKFCEQEQFDAVIVGSDQVWRAIYVPNIEDYFLSFVKNKSTKKIAYAASFGTRHPEYSNIQKTNCGKLTQSMTAISVREANGLDIFQEFGWDNSAVKVVLDPTMLLPKSHYENLIKHNHKKELENNIFCYILDLDTKAAAIIKQACNILHKKTYDIIDMKKRNNANYVLPSIEDWLTGIHDSSFVITDSFHGTIFSILFNNPFAVYVNENRGADRFYSLLKVFGLEDRIITINNSINTILQKKIDWGKVNQIIENEKQQSLLFLKQALN